MRHIVSAVTLAAFAAGLFAPALLPAQTTVSPELSERLRTAVAERQTALGLPDSDALAARLADGALRDEATLDDLVAPVALYPDALLAQVLAAAAFPDQIARAGALIDEGDAMSDQDLTDAIAAEDWDPSVLVLLSGFPTVIARMADDLDWTADLGGAMLHQDADVLAAVQRMRTRAEAAGNLQTNAAQVVDKTPEAIAIRPASPEKVYVPDYDPNVVYLSSRNPAPYVPSPYASTYVPTAPAQAQAAPGFDMTTALVSGAVGFGAGYLVNQLVNDDDHDNKNKNKNKNDGWDDYWKQTEPIDWRDRQVYPRPGWGAPPRSWREDRDRYWNRGDGRWQLDEAARRRDAEERRGLMPWMAAADPARLSDREQARMRAWRDQARREAQAEAARDRAVEQRRVERAREAADRRAAAARQDRREDQAAANRRAAEDRRAAAAQQERREAQAAADRRAAAQDRREKQAAADRRAAQEQRRAAAARQDQREDQAATERRAAQERRDATLQQRAKQQRAEQQRAAAAKADRAAEARKAEAARAKAAQDRRAKAAADRPKPAATQQAPQREAKPQPPRKQPPAEARQAQPKPKPQAAETQRRQQQQQQQAAKKKCKPNDERKECRQG